MNNWTGQNGTYNFYGYTAPLNVAVAWVDDFARLTWQDMYNGTVDYDIYEKVGTGNWRLVGTTAVGAATYDNYTQQNASVAMRVTVHGTDFLSDASNEVIIQTPLVFFTDQTVALNLLINNLNIGGAGTVNVNWGDGTDNDYAGNNAGINHVYLAGTYYVAITGDVNLITTLDMTLQGICAEGDISKWTLPAALINLDIDGNEFTGDLSNWTLPGTLVNFNITNNNFTGDLSGWVSGGMPVGCTGLTTFLLHPGNNFGINVPASYTIERKNGVLYAKGSRTGMVEYSGQNFNTIITNCMWQLYLSCSQGGTVHIKNGLYDGLDQIIVPGSHITIEGESRYSTVLKMADAMDDAYGARFALIQINGHDDCTIRNIKLDGNGENQTKIDNGASTDAIEDCIYTHDTNRTVIENCFIYNCTMTGIETHSDTDLTIRNCFIQDGYWNGVTFGWGTRNNIVEDCLIWGSGDVGVAVFGDYNVVKNSIIKDITGVHGSGNTMVGISFEPGGTVSADHLVLGNLIDGSDGMTTGIAGFFGAADASERISIIGNTIKECDYGLTYFGNNSHVLSNSFINCNTIAVNFQGAEDNTVSGNFISADNTMIGIALTINGADLSHRNIVNGNTIKNAGGAFSYAVAINTGCGYNMVLNNVIYGSSGEQADIQDLGTNSIINNNYGMSGLRWQPETGDRSIAYTATVGGLTTGIIKPGSQYAVVTSASADNICCLPSATQDLVGTIIRGKVGANGFELRVAAAQAATVYLNGVTTNVEAAIPANHTFEVQLIDTTHWILKAWTALGAYVLIVPDAV